MKIYDAKDGKALEWTEDDLKKSLKVSEAWAYAYEDAVENMVLQNPDFWEKMQERGLIGDEWGNKHAHKKEPRQADGTALAERWAKLL